MRPVSSRLSPFLVAVELPCSTLMTCPPKRHIAASNERRVRVLGSKNKVAKILPVNSESVVPEANADSILAASDKIRNRSS